MSKTTFDVLNLGAGVQSTLLYLMAAAGELARRCDCAIFADTGEEPGYVYRHLEWLQAQPGPPILVRGVGSRMGDDLLRGENTTGQKFAGIPAFTRSQTGEVGKLKRQCTAEYKVAVVERTIRRELLGLEPRERIPSDVRITQWFGFSHDEAARAARVGFRLNGNSPVGVWSGWFPLWERGWNRFRCEQELLRFGIPHKVEKSACTFCPYRSNREWQRLRDEHPEDWQRACEIDDGLRREGIIVNRGMEAAIYVHRSCRPLSEAPLGDDQIDLFERECEGGCGT